MAKPAADAFQKIKATHPNVTVTSRTKLSLTADVGDGKRVLVSTIGAMHFTDDQGQLQEVDTAWTPSVGQGFDHEMVLAPYQAFAKNVFNWGDIVEYRAATGESIKFSPINLQWRDKWDSVGYISAPQAAQATVEDDRIFWPNAYGNGRHFEWRAHPTRLQKLLTIDSAADLPAAPSWLADPIGLEVSFAFTPSPGVEMWVDGQLVETPGIQVTSAAIEFRKNGEVLWALMPPKAWDSSGDPDTGHVAGELRVEWQSNDTRYVSVRIPQSWLASAVYPVFIDPTVQSSAAPSNIYYTYSTYFGTGEGRMGYYATYGIPYEGGALFEAVPLPAGAQVTQATATLNFTQSSASIDGRLAFENTANADLPTGYSGHNALALTDKVSWLVAPSGVETTPDLAAPLQQLLYDNTWVSGNSLLLTTSAVAGDGPGIWDSASLFIEYEPIDPSNAFGISSWTSPGSRVYLSKASHGWVFTVGSSDLTVLSLRNYGASELTGRVVRNTIYRNSDDAVIASVDITTKHNEWVERFIPEVTLEAGVTYTVSSWRLSDNGYVYRNPTGITYDPAITVVNDGVYTTSGPDVRPTLSSSNNYTPPADFRFVVADAAPPAIDGTAAGSGAGTGSGLATPLSFGSASGVGVGLASSLSTVSTFGVASGTGSGSASAVPEVVVPSGAIDATGVGQGSANALNAALGDATGNGAGTGSVTGLLTSYGVGSSPGIGSGISSAYLEVSASAAATGSGLGSASASVTSFAEASGVGTGSGSVSSETVITGSATGSGVGAGQSTAAVDVVGVATGTGTGTGESVPSLQVVGVASGSSISGSSVTSLVVVEGQASGTGTGSGLSSTSGFVTGVATGSGVGTGALSGSVVALGDAAGTGQGSSTSAALLSVLGASTGTGEGVGSAVPTNVVVDTGSGAGTGSGLANTEATVFGDASGLGTGLGQAATEGFVAGQATGVGQGSGTAVGLSQASGAATGTGQGSSTSQALLAVLGTSLGSGEGVGTASGLAETSGQATGSGSGLGTSSGQLDTLGTASGSGVGSGSALGTILGSEDATGVATGSGLATATVTTSAAASGPGLGSGLATASVTAVADAAGTGVGSGTAAAGAVSTITSGATSGTGLGSGSAIATLAVAGAAAGAGTSAGTSSGTAVALANAPGAGVGSSAAASSVEVLATATGVGAGSGSASRAPATSTGLASGTGVGLGSASGNIQPLLDDSTPTVTIRARGRHDKISAGKGAGTISARDRDTKASSK